MKKVLLVACGYFLLATVGAMAQPAAKNSGDFKYSAPKVTLRNNGVRLDGTTQQMAQISSPELDVTALAIAFDFSSNQIQEVRAIGQVKIRLDMADKDPKNPVTHIRSSSDSATLNPVTRQLVLKGNVDGYYQTGEGPRTTLMGNQATINQQDGQVTAQLQGPVKLTIPPEDSSRDGALGSVVITSKNASIDQATGQAIFSGDARAVSTEGANQFDVRAPQFTLTRNANGNIDTIATQGKTNVKIDLPPETAKEGDASKIGNPTHIEVTSDAAVLERATNKLTFTDNVDGFYVLSPAEQEPQKYNFSGDKAILTQITDEEGNSNFNADITGRPVTIFAPDLSLNIK